MKTRIEDISKASGFSCATVSRVVTGKSNVKENTRIAIEQAIKQLGYKSTPAALRANRGTQKTVMMITGDLVNPFYSGLIRSADHQLNKSGYLTMLGVSDYLSLREEEYLAYAQEQHFAGIIMVTAVETEKLKALIADSPCPIVMVNRYIKSMDLDVVCIDNYRGGYMAADYLISMGHHAIAHLAGPQNSTASQDRMRGFIDAMREAGLGTTNEAISYGDLKRASGYQFGKQYLKQLRHYSAVFLANDLMAVGFEEALQEAGLRIPEDVSVICFDDMVAREGKFPFTTISREPEAMGKSAAKMLLERINGIVTETRKMIYPPKIQTRSSVKKYNK